MERDSGTRAGLAILMGCLGEDAIPKGTVSQLTAVFLGPNTGEGSGELQNETMEERRQEASPIAKCLSILGICTSSLYRLCCTSVCKGMMSNRATCFWGWSLTFLETTAQEDVTVADTRPLLLVVFAKDR